MSFDSRWKRRLVRKGSPSPANMRVGSSFSRLKENTPAVNGKAPGRFSRMRHFRISPWSSKPGSATFGTLVPEREIVLSRVWISRSRTLTTCSSRSEEHTSELQSHLNLVCRLLLEKKKQNITNTTPSSKNKTS